MHPAFSVLFLTTFIGVGQGLFMALYTSQVFSLMGLIAPPPAPDFYTFGSLAAFGWLGAGLFASFFHLGRPLRGWRAITRWQSSWLSREVLVLPLVMTAIAIYGGLHWAGINPDLWIISDAVTLNSTLIAGFFTTLLTVLLFLCTGMIYADVHLLQEWRHWLTVLNFILLGMASGFTFATGIAHFLNMPPLIHFFSAWALILIFIASITRIAALLRNAYLTPRSTLRTAIGIRHHQISQKSQGAMAGSFNTREFFHGCKLSFILAVRNSFLILTFMLPILFLAWVWYFGDILYIIGAFLSQILGLLAERWYFFAEARHPQNLYYQSVA